MTVSDISNSNNDSDIVTIKFRSSEKATSGVYKFEISATENEVNCKGCNFTISPSATSEIADVYIESKLYEGNDSQVVIPVQISNNKGVMGYRLSVGFDNTVLEPVSVASAIDGNIVGTFTDPKLIVDSS